MSPLKKNSSESASPVSTQSSVASGGASGTDNYELSSSLEDNQPTAIGAIGSEPSGPSPAVISALAAKQRQRWIRFGILSVVLVAGLFIVLPLTRHQSTASNGSVNNVNNRFNAVNIPLESLNNTQTTISSKGTVSIDGQLNVNNALVLSPMSKPSDAVAGQLYYDQNTHQLSLYNGTSFVNILSGKAITGIDGNTGDISTGSGLSINNGRLSSTGVLSIQGQAGNVTLTGGNGIAVNGTTLSNTGVVSIGGRNGAITLGSGLTISGNQLQSSGVASITAGTNISVTNDGSGNFTISAAGGGGSGTVSSPGGTINKLAKFTGVQAIGDSLISDNGVVVTIGGNLNVSGTVTLSAPLAVTSGGTGATTPNGARANLGAAASGANGDITSLSGLTTALSVTQGGTGVGTLPTNSVLVGNGTSAVSGITGANGSCLLMVGGTPTFTSCPTGGNVSGSGTGGTIPLWNGSGSVTALTDSILSQSGTTVTVAGDLSATNLSGNGSGVTNVNAAQLGGQASSYYTNAANISSGTLSDSRLSTNVTLQGNTFNGANQLLQLNASGYLPALNGSLLTNVNAAQLNGQTGSYYLNASNIDSGTIGDTYLSSNVTLQGNTFNGASQLVQLDASTQLPAVSGVLLTNLNGSNIASGTVANARLVNSGALAVTAGTGLTGGGNVALGGSTTLNVAYGAAAGQAVQGNVMLTCASGTGNLSGGGDVITLGNGGSCSGINITDTPTFNSVTVGDTTSVLGQIILHDGSTTNTAIVKLGGALSNNVVYTLPNNLSGNQTICTVESGNCAGSGSGVTASGSHTQNYISKFSNAGGSSISNSSIYDDGSGVSVGGSSPAGLFNVGASNQFQVSGTGSLTAVGVNAGTGIIQGSGGLTVGGTVTLSGLTSTGGQCLTTDSSGVLSLVNCLSGAGGGSSGVASLNGLSGTLTINNALAAGSTITINDAKADGVTKGIAAFNSTNFTDASGVINTIQGIATNATPTFAGLTLNGSNFSTDGIITSVSGSLASGTINLGTSVYLTGTLGVTKGGTGLSSLTSDQLLYAASSSSISQLANGSSGECLVSNGAGSAPSFQTCTGAGGVSSITATSKQTGDLTFSGTPNQVSVTNSGTTFTFATPQDIATSSDVSFNSINSATLLQTNSTTRIDASGNLSNIGTVTTSGLITGGSGLTISAGTITFNNLSGGSSTCLTLDASNHVGTAACATGGGSTPTLQDVYNNSATTPVITLNTTGNGVRIQDATTPIGSDLLAVTNNGGSTKYFAVTVAGASVTGTLNATDFSGNGAGITNVDAVTLQGQNGAYYTNASNINAGTIGDTYLSSNVALYNRATSNFTGTLQHNGNDVCDASGNCTGVSGGAIGGSGTVNKLALFTGSGYTIGDSMLSQDAGATTVTVSGALNVTGSLTLGTALSMANGGTSATTPSGARTNLGAAASGANNDITSLSGLTTALSVGQGGTGQTSLTANGVVFGNGTNGLQVTSAGSGGQILLANNLGVPTFATVSGDITIDSAGVTTIGAGKVTNAQLANSSLTVTAGTGLTGGGVVTLGGSTSLSVSYGSTTGTAVEGSTTLTCPSGTGNLSGGGNSITLGAGGSCNGITITNSPTFSGTLTVAGSGGTIIGQAGSIAGVLTLANSTNSNLSILKALAPTGTGDVIYNLPQVAGGTTQTVCTIESGNCAGSGSGVTGSGTSGNIAKFNGSGSIADSNLSESSTTLTYTGNVVIQGNNSLQLGTAGPSGKDGAVSFANSLGTHIVTLQAPTSDPASDLTFYLPSAYGSNGSCLISDGSGGLSFSSCTGGAGGGVTSINNQAGVVTIANATGSSGTITLNDAKADGITKGIAAFNSTNFKDASGVINTAQDITTTSDVSFNSLTLTTALSILNGGTGATTNTGARTNLGAAASGANNDITSLSGLTTALSVGQGGTGAATLTANGVLIGNSTSAITAVAAGSTGQCLVSTAGAPTWTTCPGSGGVTSVNGLNGVISIANSSAAGSTITLNDAKADGSTKGIAAFSASNFADNGSGLISIKTGGVTSTEIADSTIANADLAGGTYSSITGTGALTTGSIASGFGTIVTANAITGTTINGTTSINTGAGAGTERIDVSGNLVNIGNISASGTITLSGLASATGQCLVLDGSNHVGTATCATGSGSTPTLQNVYDNSGTSPKISLSTTGKGLLIQDATTPIGSDLLAVTNNGGSTKYFAVTVAGASVTGTLNATDFSGNGAGITNVDAVTLQGQNGAYYTNASNINAGTIGDTYLSSNVALYNRATSNFTGTLQHNGNDVCDASGNCTGVSGGAIGGSGTVNKLALFTGSGYTIGDSMLSQDAGATTVTVSGNLAASGTIQGTQLISTVAAGTAPLAVTSNTKVANLNADLLDGLDSTAFQAAGAYAPGTAASYIQNQNTAAQTSSNFWIDGTGVAATLQAGTFDAATAGALNIGLTSGGVATSININQNTTVTGFLNATTGFKYNGTAGSTITACTAGQYLTGGVQGGIMTSGSCSTPNAAGAAGGDLTGNYPNPTIAKLQGSTLTISSPVTGQVLNYNGTAWINTSSPTISGLLTVNGGLTAKGTININTTGTSNTNIGNSTGTTAITGNFTTGNTFNLGNFVYSSYGGFDYSLMLKNNFVSIGLDHSSSDDYIDLTGNTNISAYSDQYSHGALLVYNNYANAINPVTTIGLGATPTSTGDALRIQNSSGTALGGFNYQGNLYYKSGASTATINLAGALGSNQIYSLPTTGGTFCIQSSAACGFAPGTAGSYIQNGTTAQTANFNIQSANAGSIAATIQGNASQTADILHVNQGNGDTTLKVTNQGVIISGEYSGPTTSAFTVYGWNNSRLGLFVNGEGQVGIGNNSITEQNAALKVTSSAISSVAAIIQGASGQTAEIFQATVNGAGVGATGLHLLANGQAQIIDGSNTSGTALTINTLNATNVAGVNIQSIGTALSASAFGGPSGIFQAYDSSNSSATLISKQAGSGSADLFQAQNSSGSALVSISSTGLLTSNGGITIAAGQNFVNGGSTLNSATALTLNSSGDIGDKTITVDSYTTFDITATTTGLSFTLPSPTNSTSGRIVYINNVGTNTFTIGSATITPGSSSNFIWNHTAWTSTAVSTGVSLVGTYSTTNTDAKGATISGNTITFQSASTSAPGMVDTGAQTFVGNKTFNGGVTTDVLNYTGGLNVGSTGGGNLILNSNGIIQLASGDVEIGSTGGTVNINSTAFQTFSSLNSFNGSVTANANASLIQIGNSIQGGNANGTYIGLNAPSSGAGSAADLMNLQKNNSSVFKIATNGDTTTTGIVTIGSGVNTITLNSAGGYTAAGTARHTKYITLPAEYAGAVLDAASDTGGANCSTNNSGIMASGFDSTAHQNFYEWVSSGASTNCYDVVVQVPIPADFSGWAATAPSLYVSNTGSSSSAVCTQAQNSSGTADSNYSTYQCATTTGSLTNFTLPAFGSSYTAGDYMTIKIRLTSTSNTDITKIGTLKLPYYSSF